MKTRKTPLLLIFGFMLLSCSTSTDKGEESSDAMKGDPNNAGLTLPNGFEALAVADEIGRARHIVVRDNGDIYVRLRSMTNGGGIAAMRDTDNDGKADIIQYFGETPGTGIDIRNGYLYYSSDTSVHRIKLPETELVPDGEPETIVSGFVFERSHAVKPFTFDEEGNIYVNVGAPSNACQEQDRRKGSPGQDPCPLLERYGGIWRFDADSQGQTQLDDGYRYATGIRNAVALDWNSKTAKLYLLQHGRDQLSFLYPDLYTTEESAELPAEEFFLVEDGSNFGWPYCYYDQIKSKKVLAPEYGGDKEETGRCEEMVDPIMAFPGHYAPNDLIFYEGEHFPERYKDGAFIAFHGSWNRAPLEQEGYNVVFVPFEDELPSGDWEVFANNFAGVETIESPGDAFHRPTGLAEGPDGSLYVADSQGGRIYRVFYSGDKSTEPKAMN